jgi:hypothetical protein
VKVGWRALQLMRGVVRQMRTDPENPKTIGGGRDLRRAARLVAATASYPVEAPRGGRLADCVPDRPGQRLIPWCFRPATLPGGGCFLSRRRTPLPN